MPLGLHSKNLILGMYCFNIPWFFCFSGVMGSVIVFNSDSPKSFLEKTGNNFALPYNHSIT